MAKRKLQVMYWETTDEGLILRMTFSRRISQLEKDGIVLWVKERLEHNNASF